MDNNGITGEYRNTIDEKGRIMFPVKARTSLPENRLIITRGMDNCLWLFPPAEWEKFSAKIMKSASLSKAGSRAVLRRLTEQETEIDKSGRISIPQSLREYASLEKECIILGQYAYFELWDVKKYDRYLEDSEPDFAKALEALGVGL